MRILLAEDDPEIGNLLEVVFSGVGHAAMVTTTGTEAIAAFDRYEVDAVVLDVMMPAVDGIEVLRHIRRHPRRGDLPVLLLTARTTEDDHLRGFEAGADAYVTKPFRPRDLLRVLEQLVEQGPLERAQARERERERAVLLRQLEPRF